MFCSAWALISPAQLDSYYLTTRFYGKTSSRILSSSSINRYMWIIGAMRREHNYEQGLCSWPAGVSRKRWQRTDTSWISFSRIFQSTLHLGRKRNWKTRGLVYLLQRAPESMTIRLSEDYFTFIRIVTFPKEKSKTNWEWRYRMVKAFIIDSSLSGDFLLVWNWGISLEKLQDRGKYKPLILDGGTYIQSPFGFWKNQPGNGTFH